MIKFKDIIYKLTGVVVLLLIGEGVFGWAIYWPALWFLLGWRYVYFLALALGFLLSGLTGVGWGVASLALVLGTGLLSWFREFLGGSESWFDVLAVVLVAFLANLVMSLPFSLFEGVVIFLVMMFWKLRGNRGDEIRV
jgi:hypothetical protein